MADWGLQVERIESAPFAQNSFVAWRTASDEALIIDPGFDTRSITELLANRGLRPVAILNTHGHADHIAGNAEFKQRFPEVPLMIGVNDARLMEDPQANLSAMFGMPFVSPPADRILADGERLMLAGLRIEIREIPGHSPGSVAFVVLACDPVVVFGGDVLFAGSVGRTDFPEGDSVRLLSGIRAKLYNLPDSAVIHSGHGPVTTVGVERRTNPFVRG